VTSALLPDRLQRSVHRRRVEGAKRQAEETLDALPQLLRYLVKLPMHRTFRVTACRISEETPMAEVIQHHLSHDAAGGVSGAEEKHRRGRFAHWQHALSAEATACGKGIQHASVCSSLAAGASGIQHAPCLAVARESS